ncbi:MAG: metal dependent phosphohydrolase [Acidimicrobiales bacterium]|nr:metal dependent phosphohydrolase [Acidimicrobiales bacterium]
MSNATSTTHATFTRMDQSTAAEWAEIGRQTAEHQPRVADSILAMLRSLGDITDGFATDQLTHCLQTATLAEKAGADDEVVVASLCHDIGKAISVPNHGPIAAEILRPYVRPDVAWMLQVHQDFQGKHYYAHFGADPNKRDAFVDHPAYALTAQFTDEWDQIAFDPEAETYPLEHFEARVRDVFSLARY